MPAIIGPVQIFNVSGGSVQFGDTLFISPKSASKSPTDPARETREDLSSQTTVSAEQILWIPISSTNR